MPKDSAAVLPDLLRDHIARLAQQGCNVFLCGGALGFDTLAAEAVIAVRNRFPAISLTLALPCPEQCAHWPQPDQQRYHCIVDAADEVITLSGSYNRYCMMQRNRFMVDHSDLLLCFLTEAQGGTAATVRYAYKQGVSVVNLAMEI